MKMPFAPAVHQPLFVKVSITIYWTKYMPLGFDAYLDLHEGRVQIKTIKQRRAPNQNTVQIRTVFGDSFISRKNSTVEMYLWDYQAAKKAVKVKQREDAFLARVEKENIIRAKNDMVQIDPIEFSDEETTDRLCSVPVESYEISAALGGETLTDYCYDCYQDWLQAWLDRGDELSAERSNLWRTRFLKFASEKA